MGRQLALRLIKMIDNHDCEDKNYTYVMKPVIYEGRSIRAVTPRP